MSNSPAFSKKFVSKDLFDILLDKTNDSLYDENTEKLKTHLDVLRNITFALTTPEEISSFQNHEFAPLINSIILKIEQGSEDVCDLSTEVLGDIYDVLGNKGEFKKKNLPKIVVINW